MPAGSTAAQRRCAAKGRVARRRGSRTPSSPQVEQALRDGATAHGFTGELWTLERIATVIQRLTGSTIQPGVGTAAPPAGLDGPAAHASRRRTRPGGDRPLGQGRLAADQANCECVGLRCGRIAVMLRRRLRCGRSESARQTPFWSPAGTTAWSSSGISRPGRCSQPSPCWHACGVWQRIPRTGRRLWWGRRSLAPCRGGWKAIGLVRPSCDIASVVASRKAWQA
jgi:hypothetical protein